MLVSDSIGGVEVRTSASNETGKPCDGDRRAARHSCEGEHGEDHDYTEAVDRHTLARAVSEELRCSAFE